MSPYPRSSFLLSTHSNHWRLAIDRPRVHRRRQRNHDGGAAPGRRGLDPALPRLRFDAAPRGWQPEPDPAAIRIVRLPRRHAEELLEHALAKLRGDARS